MTDLEAAYLAGIIDGEGSVMLAARADTASARLAVANTCRVLLEWIVKATELGVIQLQRKETGNHRASYMWHTNGGGAESVLRQIRPYLIVKPVQADLAISFQERLRVPKLKMDRSWQMEAVQQMRALNRRGPRVES